MNALPDVQLFLRPGITELGWGHPDPALLPVTDIAHAAASAMQRGQQALAYGAEQGPGCLLELLARWLTRRESASVPREHLFITAGASQGLDLLCTLLIHPGDTVLVQAPVYHLALRIMRDHGLDLAPVESDEGGLRIDALAAALADLQRQGRPPRFLYCVPTWGNPTGISMDASRRVQLVRLAEASGLLVLEDDVYRELWYDAASPPSLQSLAAPGVVIRLGSFSKILAPGLRLGWLAGTPDLVRRCTRSGLLDSGGGVNHFTAHVVAAYLEQGVLDRHIERLRQAYRERRDALLAALACHLPACSWNKPGGGFFAWVSLPPGLDSAALLPKAEAAGVSYVAGTHFYADGRSSGHIRLSFALLPAADFGEGVKRMAAALRQAERRAG